MAQRPTLHALQRYAGETEILGLGRFRRNLGHGHEVQVEACVADGFEKGSIRSVGTEWIGVGQLGLLTPGDRFRDGQKIRGANTERFRGRLSLRQSRTERIGLRFPRNDTEAQLSDSFSNASGWLLKHCRSDSRAYPKGSGVPHTVLLPMPELVRALFGSSSEMLKQVFDGRRDPSMLPSRFRIDYERSCCDEAGHVEIHADRALADGDARVVAMMLADRSRGLLRFRNSVSQNFQTDSDFSTGRGAHLDLQWPWERSVEMEFEGRWMACRPAAAEEDAAPAIANRFVVTRICEVVLPEPPTAIEVRHPRDIRHDDRLPPGAGRVLLTGAGERPIRSDRRPELNHAVSTFDEAGTDFPALNAIKVNYVATEQSYGRKDHSTRRGPDDGDGYLSTDDAVPGGDKDTSAATIRRSDAKSASVEERAVDVGLRKTWTALEELASRKGWTTSYWTGGDIDAGPVRRITQPSPEHQAKVAVIRTSGGLTALADTGSGTGAPASLGVVPQWSGHDERELAEFVFEQARRLGWKWLSGRNRNGVKGRSVVGHRRAPQCFSDPLHYVAKLEQWLNPSSA